MEVLKEVKKVVATVCEVSVDEISETTAIGDLPQWDSIGHLTILSTIESEFDINFDPEEMMDLEDVKDIVKAVETKL